MKWWKWRLLFYNGESITPPSSSFVPIDSAGLSIPTLIVGSAAAIKLDVILTTVSSSSEDEEPTLPLPWTPDDDETVVSDPRTIVLNRPDPPDDTADPRWCWSNDVTASAIAN